MKTTANWIGQTGWPEYRRSGGLTCFIILKSAPTFSNRSLRAGWPFSKTKWMHDDVKRWTERTRISKMLSAECTEQLKLAAPYLLVSLFQLRTVPFLFLYRARPILAHRFETRYSHSVDVFRYCLGCGFKDFWQRIRVHCWGGWERGDHRRAAMSEVVVLNQGQRGYVRRLHSHTSDLVRLSFYLSWPRLAK